MCLHERDPFLLAFASSPVPPQTRADSHTNTLRAQSSASWQFSPPLHQINMKGLAIIALAARGEAGAKREAFEDLKAVASMLS